MNYNLLLDMTTKLGYHLAMYGAETYRVEESITRILAAYQVKAEVFAIPNCLIVSIETADGTPMTRMRRIAHHGSNMEGVERISNLSRKICAEIPDPEIVLQWLKNEVSTCSQHTVFFTLLGAFLGAFGFAIFFGGSFVESLCSGICGILISLITLFMEKRKVNPFFTTIAASFFMALTAYALGSLGVAGNTGPVIIGALMSLVPGWLFTNGLRDIIFGDTNSGINRIVQVFLIAAALALGTGVAWNIINMIRPLPAYPEAGSHSDIINCLAAFIGCYGFLFTFNIHGKGGILCALGGSLVWAVWCVGRALSGNEYIAYLCAAIFAALYSEAMARIRKYPAISYQVISMFPMIPGAGIYYTTNYLVRGDLSAFADKGGQTVAVAGILAVGILLVSTVVRFWTVHKNQKHT